MAVNQPPIPDDAVTAAWMLEVTREINEMREQMQRLLQQIEELQRSSSNT